jgi:hypothetical protein
LIVSARKADPSGQSNAGKSYVIFGKQDNTAINLSAIALITKPPVPAEMADKLIAVLSCLPNTTYDLKPIQVARQTQANPMSSSAKPTLMP